MRSDEKAADIGLDSRHVEDTFRVDDNFRDEKKMHDSTVGTTELMSGGQLKCIPMPTSDPNGGSVELEHHKEDTGNYLRLFLSQVGAIALGVQQIISGLLPVFMLVYAGVDPAVLNEPGGLGSVLGGMGGAGAPPPGVPPGVPPPGVPSGPPPELPENSNPLAALGDIPGALPLSRVNLLASMPVLMVGLANYVLVPLSAVIGRRAVLVGCALLAWVCTVWAGASTSFESHLAARCVQSIGAGAVESLIPLYVADLSFIHQRGRAIAVVWASTGIVALSMGVGSNYIVARMGWRWMYYICGIITAISWVMIVVFVPETRWRRSLEELKGNNPDLPPGSLRPAVEGKASFNSRYGAFANGGLRLGDGWLSFKELFASFLIPTVFYCVVFNSTFLGISLGSNLTLSTVVLAPPYNWPLDKGGYVVFATFIATIAVYLISGLGADRITLWLTKRKGGKREPEVHLWNFYLPVLFGIFGCILYGIGGEYVYKVHWMCILSGACMLQYAFLAVNIQCGVFCVESFPHLAGPVLINVSSFRNVIAFGFTYGMPVWVATRGYIGAFGIFAGVMALISLPLPFLMMYGKRLRERTTTMTSKMASHSI